jgi:hypothetical protein
MRDNDFPVTVIDDADMGEIKERHHVPAELQSCHTAIVDGYVVEGHVPAADVERLLEERPAITGIAVPGMPLGSPGMEVEGSAPQPFDVIAFDESGNMEVFASYTP